MSEQLLGRYEMWAPADAGAHIDVTAAVRLFGVRHGADIPDPVVYAGA